MKFLKIMLIALPITCSASICNNAGNFDKYILALSWLPGLCETHSFPECFERQNHHQFNLHGLWPDKKICGIDYSFCQKEQTYEADFCKYPKVSLNKSILADLLTVMPGIKYDNCLERHEWWKHGTCTKLDPNSYYQISISYVKQFNAYLPLDNYLNKKINVNDFYQYFDSIYGDEAHKSIQLVCENDLLTEIWISLPADFIEKQLDLNEAIGKVTPYSQTNCGDSFTILD